MLVSLRPELTRLDITPADSSPGVSLDIRHVHTIQVYEYMGELSGIQSNVNYDVPQNLASLKARSENAIKKPLQLLVYCWGVRGKGVGKGTHYFTLFLQMVRILSYNQIVNTYRKSKSKK